MVCDICGVPGTFNEMTSEKFKEAVRTGFNPFKSGLIETDPVAQMMGMSSDDSYETWKSIALQNSTNWNLCPRCWNTVLGHLEHKK